MAFSNITNTLPEAHKLLQQDENLQWQRFWAVSIFGVAIACKGNNLCNIGNLLPKRHNFEKKWDSPSTTWWVPLPRWTTAMWLTSTWPTAMWAHCWLIFLATVLATVYLMMITIFYIVCNGFYSYCNSFGMIGLKCTIYIYDSPVQYNTSFPIKIIKHKRIYQRWTALSSTLSGFQILGTLFG